MYSMKWSNSAQFDVSVQGVSSLNSLLLGAFACEAQHLPSSGSVPLDAISCNFIYSDFYKQLLTKDDLA
jgi:hypothetical protein